MKMQTIEPRSYDEADCEECTAPEPIDVLRFQRGIRAITGKWKIEIVCSLIEGPLRFGELRRRLSGVTQHMLTEQLRELAGNGIVIRTAFAENPPRVEYELSQAGIDLMPAFLALRDWTLKYEDRLEAP